MNENYNLSLINNNLFLNTYEKVNSYEENKKNNSYVESNEKDTNTKENIGYKSKRPFYGNQ